MHYTICKVLILVQYHVIHVHFNYTNIKRLNIIFAEKFSNTINNKIYI